ncbi:MAG TPA: alkaline phosphatase PhoX [Terriglobales bacterium]|nr:alkaline phosphatase PhoX [Terriglobales bacterium]
MLVRRRLLGLILLSATAALAQTGIGPVTHSVPFAHHHLGNPATVISAGFKLLPVVDGSVPIENPSGVITSFGFLSTGTPTEPDENTYLVFDSNPGGPAPGYDYGRHFVFQGHENSGNLAYITRVNLDVADAAHRVTLLTPVAAQSGLTNFNSIDGSTYDPYTNTMLFTQEAGSNGGVIQVTTSWPPTVNTLHGILGRAGYEGIHPDDLGNLLIIEDAGGTSVNVNPNDPNSPKVARQPNSFVYRFIPKDPTNLLAGGKLEALRVSINGAPLVFHAADPSGDVFATTQLALHTPGTSYPVDWVTVHDTDLNGTASFDANAAAKTAGATPFKRPENGQFLPGSNFLTFFFDPTGDTNADAGTPALAARGSWGSIFRVDLAEDRNTGMISIFVLGDAVHASFDNLTFSDDHTLLAAEDRGDTLHQQLNTLDSVWAFATDRSSGPRRFIALGRDHASVLGGEDNEPTGLHVSAGGTTVSDLPGTWNNLNHPRVFLTRQHGDNQLWEIVPSH